jgi:hypothetical protein
MRIPPPIVSRSSLLSMLVRAKRFWCKAIEQEPTEKTEGRHNPPEVAASIRICVQAGSPAGAASGAPSDGSITTIATEILHIFSVSSVSSCEKGASSVSCGEKGSAFPTYGTDDSHERERLSRAGLSLLRGKSSRFGKKWRWHDRCLRMLCARPESVRVAMHYHETPEKNSSTRAFTRSYARFRLGGRVFIRDWIPRIGHRPFGFLTCARENAYMAAAHSVFCFSEIAERITNRRHAICYRMNPLYGVYM